jgi:GH24 family phage-related lysozyme (muramidase)
MRQQPLTAQADAAPAARPHTAGRVLQRKCACGKNTAGGGACGACSRKDKALQRQEAGSLRGPSGVPDSVYEVLGSAGSPLDASTRSFFESRFGQDFSGVRVHADSRAAESAAAVNAHAYTVGRDVVFASGRYAPQTNDGKRLIAHELTHVVQQRDGRASAEAASLSSPGDRFEREADSVADALAYGAARRVAVRETAPAPFLGRDNAAQTGAVLRRGTVRGSGLQFFPLQVTNTRIGPVSGQGGMAEETRSNLMVIVGQAMTLRRMAALLLPLWNSATPFTPPGAAAPLVTPPLDADTLARGLLVYNRYYLRVVSQPAVAMTGWEGGLRFPLPVQIDANGEAVVNKDLIVGLAGTFDAAWEPLLDQPASAVAAPAAANTQQAVTTFLAATPDTLGRGVSLAARSIKNPVEAAPFVTEAFSQLGASGFDVALAFMDFAVNQNIEMLATQRAGATVLGVIRAALAAAPQNLSASQQQSLTRANLMLGRVTTAVPRDVPFTLPDAVSTAGVHMIGGFEGFCPNLYDDGSGGCRRGVGHCTIGWGHLVHRDPCDGRESETPFLAGITMPQADQLLSTELANFATRVRTRVTVPITQQQFDALVSFDFNTGRLDALLPDVNGNNFAHVPVVMNQFIHSGGQVMGGLVTRRAAEGTLFTTGVYP